MLDLFGRQGGEQEIGAEHWVGGGSGMEQVAAVRPPEGVRAGTQPRSGSAGLRHQDEIELGCDQLQVGLNERGQPGRRRSTGTEGRLSGEDLLLEPGLVFSFDPELGYTGLLTGKKAAVIYTAPCRDPTAESR